LRVDAYAKLTLSLHVTGVRADGYHELDALIATVSEPHDVLEIERASHTSLDIVGPFAAGVPTDASNLVWRALDAIGAYAHVRVEKGIPHGAGLGGGSADAAAVLRAFGANTTIAKSLGADVPFCVRGGAARVRGIGEQLEPVELAPKFVVIATPRFACATVDVYRAWDALGGPRHETNDLEAPALSVEPRLAAFKDAVGPGAILAGSGSSYALVFDQRDEAERARTRIAAKIDGWTWLGTTTGADAAINP
jgi:4-diphosphocytidyl-2-C-methyl-D-erythritol kinase